MAEKLGEAVLEIRTDDSQLDAGIAKAKTKASGLADSFNAQGRRMQDLGAKLSIGLTAPLAAFAIGSVKAAKESAEAAGQVEAALRSMGNASGHTLAQLQALATNEMNASLYDDDEILRKVTANLLTFGNVSGQVFDQAQQAAIDVSARMGTDLQSSAVMLGKALNDPAKGIMMLTRVGIQFTDQQKEQIKAMAKAGDTAGAQKVMLGELQRQFAGSAQAMADADPAAKMKHSFDTLQETIGSKILPLLGPVANAVASVLEAFNRLPAGVQTGVVAFLGIGAAVGPALIGIGSLARGVGVLLPLMTGLGPVIGIVGQALLALLANPIVLGAAAVILGIYEAWKHWDQIKAIVAALGAAISGWWSGNVKPVLDAIGTKLNQVVSWFGALPGKIGGALQALASSVKQWLQDRLGAVFDWLKGKIEAAAGWFKWLGDVVVHHSYVPDMVDAVGQHIARLDGLMVKPIEKVTKASAAAFKKLKDDVDAVLDQLFPEIAEAKRRLEELTTLQKGFKAGLIDESTFMAAQSRSLGTDKVSDDVAHPQVVDQLPGGLTIESVDQLLSKVPELNRATSGWGRTMSEVLGSSRRALDDLNNGIVDVALHSGSLKEAWHNLGAVVHGVAEQWLGDLLKIALKQAEMAVFKMIFSSASGGMGFAGGFATGGLIPVGSWGIVGEKGPEPIISTPRGPMVMPNSTMRSGQVANDRGAVFAPVFNNDYRGADPAAVSAIQARQDQFERDLPGRIISTVQDGEQRFVLRRR